MSATKPVHLIFDTFKKTIHTFQMVGGGEKIVVACSGGPDSMALLSLFLNLKKEMDLDLFVAHFNHGLRPEADEEEAFVRDYSRQKKLVFVSEKTNVRLVAAERKENVEETGRRLRYNFLARTASSLGAARIATGHTLNDQAETVLIRLFRGTGISGLVGIAPAVVEKKYTIIRPLIEISRETIENYLRDEGIPYMVDCSNLDPGYLRNRIRLELVPLLQRDYQPNIIEHLGRLAILAWEEERIMNEFIGSMAGQVISGEGKDISLDFRLVELLPRATSRRVIREFIRRIKGDLRAVSYDDVEAVRGLLDGQERVLTGKLRIRRERGRVFAKSRNIQPGQIELTWSGQGEVNIAECQMKFRGSQFSNPGLNFLGFNDSRRVFVDMEKMSFPLVIRNQRPGDRYRPLNAPGRRKIKEMLRAKGISADERDRLPVFYSGGRIIWVPGLPVSDDVKVSDKTETIYSIEKI